MLKKGDSHTGGGCFPQEHTVTICELTDAKIWEKIVGQYCHKALENHCHGTYVRELWVKGWLQSCKTKQNKQTSKKTTAAQILKCVCFPCNWATQFLYATHRLQKAIHFSDVMVPSTHRQAFRKALGFIYLFWGHLSLAPLHHSLPTSRNRSSQGSVLLEAAVRGSLGTRGTLRGASCVQWCQSSTSLPQPGAQAFPSTDGWSQRELLICSRCLFINHALETQYKRKVFLMVNRM